MNSLRDLLTEHRVPFAVGGEHRHVREGWIGVDCPRCGGGEKWHLGIHEDTLAASCWRCGRISIGEILAELLRIPTPQAWGVVKGLPRGPRTLSEGPSQRGVLRIPKRLQPLLQPHRSYLKGRGFDSDSLERIWDLSGFGLRSRLAWRIFIPIHLNGEVVSWTTRSIRTYHGGPCERSEPKYINANPDEEVYPINTLLYGWDRVRHSVVLCEGPTDVWRIGAGAVAAMGLNISSSQMQLLARVPNRTICFDDEVAAQRRAKRLCEELGAFPGTTRNVLLDAADPGEASAVEIRELWKLLEKEERDG